jgi:uncharacterized protein YaeQ
VGQPEEKLVRKACGRASQVVIYTYSGHSAAVWWRQNGPSLEKLRNLTVINLPAAAAPALARLAQRTMTFTCTIQDGQVWLSDGSETVHIDLQPAKAAE